MRPGEGGGEEGGEKSFENYRRAAISPVGVLNFLPRGFTGRQLGPPSKKPTVSFGPRCVFHEMADSQLIFNERRDLTQRLTHLLIRFSYFSDISRNFFIQLLKVDNI